MSRKISARRSAFILVAIDDATLRCLLTRSSGT
jgi:hypothetical protein